MIKAQTATTKLFVGGLSAEVTEQLLQRTFEQYGDIARTSLAQPSAATQGDRFGFVEFVEPDGADAAVAGLNGTTLAGQTLRVSRVDRRNAEGDDLGGWQRPRTGFSRRGRPRKPNEEQDSDTE